MSGICGFVARGGPMPSAAEGIARQVRELGSRFGGEGSHVLVANAALGAGEFPHRLAGTTRCDVGGCPLAIAFHGNLFGRRDAERPREGSRGVEEILSLYLRKGAAVLADLHGEFALAIWDGRDESLLLATDRFRVHPLFYAQDAGGLVFASRMRSLRAAPIPLSLSIDPGAIVQVLAASIVPTPGTIFREVKKLPPGHALTWRRGEASVAPYWEIDFRSPSRASERELALELKERFGDAVAVRLEEDRASGLFGTYLSGGVDSSTVTGLLTRLAGEPVRTFSIGFAEARYNEMSFARTAASAFGARHHEYIVTPKDAVDAVPILVEAFDEPFANASAVPAYYCARLAREHGVEVLYAGDGGDELFAGNERYAEQRLFEYWHRIPWWPRERLVRPAMFLGARLTRKGPFIAAKKYVVRASPAYHERLSAYGLFEVVPMAALLEDGLLEALGADFDVYASEKSHFLRAPAVDPLDRHLYTDLKVTISDNDILKVIRTSEAAGIAARFPFLDERLAEFAATVPAGIKMRGRTLRTFFKRAYSDLLPEQTRAKSKHGFGLPVHLWIRDYAPLNEMMRDLVLDERSVGRGYFRRKALVSLVENHRTDRTAFYGTVLWNLMVLELWHRSHWR
jgi:asparagine synthase (glutamine-hydrolysing)